MSDEQPKETVKIDAAEVLKAAEEQAKAAKKEDETKERPPLSGFTRKPKPSSPPTA